MCVIYCALYILPIMINYPKLVSNCLHPTIFAKETLLDMSRDPRCKIKLMSYTYSTPPILPATIIHPPNCAVFRQQIFHPKTIFKDDINTSFLYLKSEEQCFEF